jgi:transcriptional regulator with XRE-family HTH domain
MDEALQYIGLNIRQLRKMRKWTQEELAKLAKISRIALIHIESGKASPTLDTLSSLARVLEVPLTYFFTARPEGISDKGSSEANQPMPEEDQVAASELELQKIIEKLNGCALPQLQSIRRIVESILQSLTSDRIHQRSVGSDVALGSRSR